MDLAHRALSGTPRADHAVGYLLQAAARTSWQGDHQILIPADLVGSEHADLGLAEFLRRRNVPGWEEQSLELSRRHPDYGAFKRIRAIAVLSVALATKGVTAGGRTPVSFEDLNTAANDLKTVAEHCLEVGFADQHDLSAYLNNAGLLLRLAGRHAECETLMQQGVPQVPNEPQLRRLLALSQAALDRRSDALTTLADDDDPENRLLAAELAAEDDPAAALAKVRAIEPTALDPRVARLRWELIGALALKTGETETLKSAIAALREQNPTDVTAALLEVWREQKDGLDEGRIQQRLRAIAAALPANADMLTRYLLAAELHGQGLSQEASVLLERDTDLSRRSPATTLYLQSLAAARRDDVFRNALAAAAPVVRDDPEILWTTAAHAWNVGDLPAAYLTIEALLTQEPDNARARLLKIEILVRQNRSNEVFAELDKRVEDLSWTRLQERFRVAALLSHFGYIERAAAFAYRLFLEHRDTSQAWMTLSMVVLKEGRGGDEGPRLWDTPRVAANVAIDLRYDDGQELFLVVEPDANLRRFDNESWEPDHPLVRRLMGLAKGERFDDGAGREGTIIELRHKYVARLHYVMQRYESRFPEIFGFRSVAVDVKRPDGLDEIIKELKARQDWFEHEHEQYRNGHMPLSVLAHRLGVDTIDAAESLASREAPLKVAMGNEPERAAATGAVHDNARKGCVLDLLAFWTAWRLQALDAIIATCGRIHLTQSVIDRLRTRREKIDFSSKDGLQSIRYEAGNLALQEVRPEVVREWRDDLDRAIAWAEANATICPLVAGEELPAALREHLRVGRSDVFDSLVLAMQAGVLLITDDLPTRELSRLIGGAASAWLHRVFEVALDQECIEFDTFIGWSAHLVNAGHNYIGVSGPVLARALRLDIETGEGPGYLFNTLSKVIGGRNAEPRSHIVACLQCLRDLWSDSGAAAYCRRPTGLLLEQLVRERYDDYGLILRMVLHQVRDLPQLAEYIHSWARGHFIPESVLRDDV